jgi:DNA-directed RNA polymerase specialized sigma24 family protein
MSGIDDELSYKQLFDELVSFLCKRGCDLADAEDRVQSALLEVFARRDTIANARAYAYAIVRKMPRRREVPVGTDLSAVGREPDATDTYQGDADITMPECLTVLWTRPQQQHVLRLAFTGRRNADIAEELGVEPATVRSTKRHLRGALRPWWTQGGNDLRMLQVGSAVYEAFLDQRALPVAPRPVIGKAWALAQAIRLDPERGAPVRPLSADEVARRRERSPLAAGIGAWALARLDELATQTGHMMVVSDAHGVVLWRGGDRGIMAKADMAGFVDGAAWTFRHAGPGGIALALITGRMVTVCRFEHFVQNQHGLSCVAIPVPDPETGHASVVLNLTGTQPRIHRAIVRELDSIAVRLRLAIRRRPAGHRRG